MENHRDLTRTPQGFSKDYKRIILSIALQGLHKDFSGTNNPLYMKKKQGMQKPRLVTSLFCTPSSPFFRVRVIDLSL
jgi:hypothetical protein